MQSTYDAQDRLISRGSETFTYTDAGELASRTDTSTGQTTTYLNSARGLVGANLPDGTQVRYDLDAMGRRAAVRKNGTVTGRYLYGLEAIGPVAELNADNTVRSRFVYATRSHVPDYMVRDGITYRFVTDEQGSVRRVVNTTTGTVEQQLSYDPYGVVLEDTEPGFQPFGYAGGLTDPDTGLVRFGARDYDPALGRWTSKDPIGFGGGDTNLYAYVAGDPVNSIDPTGLILDTLVDIGFIAYDLYKIGDSLLSGCGITSTDGAPLAADVGLAFIPFGTGGGAAIRGASKAADDAPNHTAPFGPPGKDFEWRGPEKGSWFNPDSRESWRPDFSHRGPSGVYPDGTPHWDYVDPQGNGWRVYPDGRLEPKRGRR